MASTNARQMSAKQHVYETLREEITSGQWSVGAQLPSMKDLAVRFGTSVFPVHQALGMLQHDGYVVKKHGSGTFIADTRPTVTIADTVALCLRAHAHVFGELTMLLTRQLHARHISPVVMDTDEPNSGDLMRNLARSGVRVFVLDGHGLFDFEVFDAPVFRDKLIVGIIDWSGPQLPGLSRVLSDHEGGGRMVARFLFGRGHRKVLVLATHLCHVMSTAGKSGLEVPLGHGHAFLQEWAALGGRWAAIRSDTAGVREGDPVRLDADRFLAQFDASDDPPTAIFGCRDVEALVAQRTIREHRPDLAGRIEIIGYFDTPWSRAADPAITTVSLALEDIASRAAEVIEKAIKGESVGPATRLVKPRLIVRDSTL